MSVQCSRCDTMLNSATPDEDLVSGHFCHDCGKEQPQFKFKGEYILDLIHTIEQLEARVDKLEQGKLP